jgi:hypothetical protein
MIGVFLSERRERSSNSAEIQPREIVSMALETIATTKACMGRGKIACKMTNIIFSIGDSAKQRTIMH